MACDAAADPVRSASVSWCAPASRRDGRSDIGVPTSGRRSDQREDPFAVGLAIHQGVRTQLGEPLVDAVKAAHHTVLREQPCVPLRPRLCVRGVGTRAWEPKPERISETIEFHLAARDTAARNSARNPLRIFRIRCRTPGCVRPRSR